MAAQAVIQTVSIKELCAAGATPLVKKFGTKAQVAALRVPSGLAITLQGACSPVIDNNTNITPFIMGQPTRYEGALNQSFTPEGDLADCMIFGAVNNYYHFMTGYLPSLAFLADERDPVTLATTDMPATLEAVMPTLLPLFAGGRPVNIRRIKHGTAYTVRNVLFPTIPQTAAAAYICRDVLLPMILKGAGTNDPLGDLGPLKLFVPRHANANARNLINQDQVQAWYVQRGFTVIDPGAMPLEQQALTFARATHIVGVEGAAMTNILFAVNAEKVLVISSPMVADEKFFSTLSKHYAYEFRTVCGVVDVRDGMTQRSDDFAMNLDVLQAMHMMGGW